MNIPISTLTLEVKIRYASAFLFLGIMSTGYFFRDMLDLSEFNLGSIESGFIVYSFYPVIFFLLWSMFNRWYFMLPAMGSLLFVYFLSLGYATIYFEDFELFIEWVFPLIGFVAEGLAFVSFGIYVHRNIKSNNRSVYFNLGIRIISCIIVLLPVLIFCILPQLQV